ncbi:OB-fold-containig protein [Flavicella sediminum]|uniref:OB-fold-containig protein n=1 Tax=Flavicella sediminum TaxID=2585141 RepID=UPI001123BDEE|nr:OB-fold-containig protein [Flavicella sediminum]
MTLYELVFSPINTPLTLLLIALTVYRVVTMLFGLDFDFDIDVDLDIDVDVDIDNDLSIDSSGMDLEDIANLELKNETIVKDKTKSLKWWQVVLIYFNFAELPFMFTLTSWVFFWWFITVLGTYITLSHHNAFGLIIFLAAILPSLIVNKIFTTPFKSIFKKLERKGVTSIDLLGREAILDSNLTGDKLGRVKVKVGSDPMIIYAKSIDGKTLKVGEKVLIIDQSKDKKYYYIKNNY